MHMHVHRCLVGDGHDGDEEHGGLDQDDLNAVAAHAEDETDGDDARQPHCQDGKEDLQQHLTARWQHSVGGEMVRW